MGYILQGVLPKTVNGKLMTVGEYFLNVKQFTVSSLPNVNIKNMQYVFGNKATNSVDFAVQIQNSSISEIYNLVDNEK